MHTLHEQGPFFCLFPVSLEHLADCDGVIVSQAVENCVPQSCLFSETDNLPQR